MDYPIGQIPQAASENKKALEVATAYARHLESIGAKVHWVRGMQTYYLPEAAYIARADVCVAGPDGILQQFGAAQLFHEHEQPTHITYPPAASVGRLYRIGLWSNAAKAAITPLLAQAFPKYHVTLGQELSVLAVYRNGLLMHSRYTPRRLKGFIEGFRAAYELTAPHPDTDPSPRSAEPAETPSNPSQ